jgi:hypothetical protein
MKEKKQVNMYNDEQSQNIEVSDRPQTSSRFKNTFKQNHSNEKYNIDSRSKTKDSHGILFLIIY